MSEHASPPRIDVRHWCQESRQIAGQTSLSKFERLIQETKGLGAENTVAWSVRGWTVTDASGTSVAWLNLDANLDMPLTCQRCLTAVDVPTQIQRSYRFVESEAQAELEDDESEEDLLVISRDFDLAVLIEDEVLMDLPVVPRHEVCPVPVKLAAADPDFEANPAKPNPFAALSVLKAKPSGDA
ncbi:MAG: DUF177 domain-containing protein [Rhodoferax sp.]|nr:DUF177 domain-containing protein [Rhodoferax sp.]